MAIAEVLNTQKHSFITHPEISTTKPNIKRKRAAEKQIHSKKRKNLNFKNIFTAHHLIRSIPNTTGHRKFITKAKRKKWWSICLSKKQIPSHSLTKSTLKRPDSKHPSKVLQLPRQKSNESFTCQQKDPSQEQTNCTTAN